MSTPTEAPASATPAAGDPPVRSRAPLAALYRRELSAFFHTPVAYVAGAVFLAVTGSLFFSTFFLFDRAELRQLFGLFPILLALMMPALAMRLVAEEKRRGTWEVLATLPIHPWQIIAAKFLALATTGAFMLLPTLLFALTVSGFGPLDPGPVAGGYLGALLLVGVYGAIGVLASTISRNETVALVVGLVAALFAALLDGFLVLLPAAVVPFVEFLSLGYHFGSFSRGLLDTRSLVYFATLIFGLLALATWVVETRSRNLRFVRIDRALVVALLVVANVVSLGSFARIDLTASGAYRLSQVTRETIARAEDPVRVTVAYNENVPAPYNGVRQFLLDLLREYEMAGESIELEIIDPATSEGRERASALGLQQIEIQEVRSDEFAARAVYLGATVEYGNVIERVDRIVSTDGLEYRLTTAIRSAITQVDALSGAAENVTVDVYASPALAQLGVTGLDTLEADLEAVFERVNEDNYNRLLYTYNEPAEAQLDQLVGELGLQPISWQLAAGGSESRGVLEIVLQYDGRIQRIPIQIFQGLFGGYSLESPDEIEATVRRSIRTLVNANPRVAWATGHGELSLADFQRGAGPFAQILRERYEIVEVDLSAPAVTAPDGEADERTAIGGGPLIPADIATLIINRPTERLSEQARFAIDQFVMNGGSLLVFPDQWYQQIPTQQQMFAGAQPQWLPIDSGLEEMLADWGVEVTDAVVLDEESFVANQGGQRQQFFQAPVLGGQSINRESSITGGINDLVALTMNELLPEADATEDTTTEDAATQPARFTALLQTSPASWTVDSPEEIGPWVQGAPAGADTSRRTIAALLEGPFESTFAAPPPPENGQAGEGAVLATDRFRARSDDGSRIVVVAGSSLTTPQVLDPQTRTPNATFLLNAVDVLSGAPGIAELRAKGLGVPRLEVVNPASPAVARWTNTILVPLSVVAFGLVMWSRRRARRRMIRAQFDEKGVA